ncbi:hypothetical protein [Pseudoduganella sp. RAF53_2]|uniref:hypothetical protein n=1 Tax=unclassified Pseudoduganella TaxID=2637179 RepID=UPI003F9793AB
MSAASFQVALTGLQDGHVAEDVAHRLARLFTQPPEKMLAILDGKRRILKQGLNEADARKYEAALHGAGCNCTVSTLPAGAAANAAEGRATRDVAAATDAALAGLVVRAEQHRARTAQQANADLAAGQKLAIDALILHGIYLVVQKHLDPGASVIAWLPIVAVMVASMLRLCRGLGYTGARRTQFVALMAIPLVSLIALGVFGATSKARVG